MPDDSFPIRPFIDAVIRHAGRATLPFQQANSGKYRATAFWYNDLVDATPGAEQVRQYLVTATDATGYDLAQCTLRADLCAPEMSAEHLLMRGFEELWTPLTGLGVSVMPAEGLHRHAARKGWTWSTDEITDGIAATSAHLAAIGNDTVPAFVLGHDVGPGGERLQMVAVGGVAHDPDGTLRWDQDIPEGCAGAPVFAGLPRGEGALTLACLGVALPGPGRNTVAPFDRIRSAVRALPS